MSASDVVMQQVIFNLILPSIGIYITYRVFKDRIHGYQKVVFAYAMSKIAVSYNKALGKYKQKLFADMSDFASKLDRPLQVLEIGAGSGANFRYYPDGTRVICIDPNPNFDTYLKASQKEYPHVEVEEFVLGMAEDMAGVENESVDCVVCTLVMCSVEEVDQSLSEVRRVLRKGGKFYFMEHVRADKNNLVQKVQGWIAPLWKIIGDGCQFRESWNNVNNAGFSHIDLQKFEAPAKGLRKWFSSMDVIKPHMMGTATK